MSSETIPTGGSALGHWRSAAWSRGSFGVLSTVLVALPTCIRELSLAVASIVVCMGLVGSARFAWAAVGF